MVSARRRSRGCNKRGFRRGRFLRRWRAGISPRARCGRRGQASRRLSRSKFPAIRQSVDLLDVEHCVALHVRDFPLDILAGFFVVLGARDAVGVNHERALADVRVEFERLPECHPDGRCEILRHR